MAAEAQLIHTRKEVGASPASLVHVGERLVSRFHFRVLVYGKEGFNIAEYSSLEELPEVTEEERVWIQVVGLHEAGQIGALCDRFQISPLVAEDILNTKGLAKVDDFEEYIFASTRYPLEVDGEVGGRQVSLILSRGILITFQEDDGELFHPLFRRMNVEGSRIRGNGPDYLAWAVLDVIADTSLALIDNLEDRLDELEDRISEGGELPDFKEVHDSCRRVAQVYRSVRSFRDIASHFRQSESTLLTGESREYFRDLVDHGILAVELTEFLRDHASSLRELYFTMTNQRMSEVMRILASLSAIFLPLSFLAGIYGMNFKFMPELTWKWAYPVLLLVFLAIGASLLRLFRKRGWL